MFNSLHGRSIGDKGPRPGCLPVDTKALAVVPTPPDHGAHSDAGSVGKSLLGSWGNGQSAVADAAFESLHPFGENPKHLDGTVVSTFADVCAEGGQVIRVLVDQPTGRPDDGRTARHVSDYHRAGPDPRALPHGCLLYTSDAADDLTRVDL